MYKVKIPATSANLGPGFDCMGVALNLYNYIEVEEIEKGLVIEINGDRDRIQTNESNLVYRSMKALFEKVGYMPSGIRIVQTNGIPITRGLGSSAACIVGGLFAANEIVGRKLNKYELAVLAATLDGHPDNTTPAILGGLIVSVLDGKDLFHVSIDIPENIRFAAFIPGFTLSTVKARRILPERIYHKDAVFNAGRAALLVASLMTGSLGNLPCAFQDRLHQPYRKKLIPDMERIIEKSLRNGARGCFLSGAGPTVIAILDGNYDKFLNEMNMYIKPLNGSWHMELLGVDKRGVDIIVN